VTKKKVIKPDDGHKHYWHREFERTGGKVFYLNLWTCRRCKITTLIDPFQEEEAQ